MAEIRFFGPFVCGEHFCDACGDCMLHDAEGACVFGDGVHRCFIEEETTTPEAE